MNQKSNKFTIVVDNHGNEETYNIQGGTLEIALEGFLNECMEEDNTGVFFELEDANLEELEKLPNFHKIGEYGIVIKSCVEELAV